MNKATFKKSFGQRLVEAIEAHETNQADFARSTMIHESNLSHYVAGDRKPGLDTMATMLRALPNTDARWLITGERA